jgi:hypothetical protein
MKKQLNELVSFDNEKYNFELEKFNDNLNRFLNLEQSFEMITGSKELKTIEYLNTFITSLSKFPNVEASVKLLDLESPYNYIAENINDVDYAFIDIVAKTVSKTAIEALKEDCTTRLSDEAQKEYLILIQIANLYNEITHKDFIHSIISTDYRNSYNVNIQSLNQIDKLRNFSF